MPLHVHVHPLDPGWKALVYNTTPPKSRGDWIFGTAEITWERMVRNLDLWIREREKIPKGQLLPPGLIPDRPDAMPPPTLTHEARHKVNRKNLAETLPEKKQKEKRRSYQEEYLD